MSCTPSTDKVRMAYGDHFCPDPDDPAHKHACPADEDFDRWLESVKRQAKAEAWDEAGRTVTAEQIEQAARESFEEREDLPWDAADEDERRNIERRITRAAFTAAGFIVDD